MLKIKCIIADDEPLALKLLQNLLEPMADICVVDACANGYLALKSIRKHSPDLVFLDIEMPGLSGFDVVRRLQPETAPLVVFTTAFNQYAIDAFDIHAVDYVLKPLNPQRLGQAVERARERLISDQYLNEKNKASIMGAIEKMFPGQQDSPPGMAIQQVAPSDEAAVKTLLIRDSGETHVIAESSIDWVDAAGDYMCVHVGDKTLVTRTTMKKLEDQLDDQQFVRIHRSTIVNVSQLKRMENIGKGDCVLHLQGGQTLRVSRHYRARLMECLG